MPAECCIATKLGSYAIDFLRLDTRPTFIVSVPTKYSAKALPGTLIFANDALREAERTGEISLEWILNEGFLNDGGGTFPTNKWRFTTVPVGGGKGEVIIVVTVTGIPVLEQYLDSCGKEVKESTAVKDVDRRRHAQTDIHNISGNGDKVNTTKNEPENNVNGISQAAPITLLGVSCTKKEGEQGQVGQVEKRGGKGSEKNDTEDLGLVSKYTSSTKPKSSIQNFTSESPKLFTDWTRGVSPLRVSQHYHSLRNVDWSKTGCGHPSTWPLLLRLVVDTVMTMPYPTTLYWGPEYTIIYNVEWCTIAQDKDPELLGKKFREGWPEVKDYFLPLLDAAYLNGQGTVKAAKQLFLHRGGRNEECYFNFSICPIFDEDGIPRAVMEQAFDQSHQIVSARRMATLQRMGELIGSVKDLDEDDFWKILLDVFDNNLLDSPFVLIYRTIDEDQSNPTSREVCFLEGNTSFPEGGYLAPHEFKPGKDCGYFSDEMKLAKETNSVVLKELDLDTIEDGNGVVYRGFGDTPTLAVVIPIQATKTTTQGFLILGLNPRRPYDEDYKLWIDLLKKEIANTAGRVRLLKAEIAKAINEETQRVAKVQAIELQEQLEKRTAELKDSELLFTRIAENIPVGLCLLDITGNMFFQNDAYLKLASLPPGSTENAWRESIYHEDRPHVYEFFAKVIESRMPMQWETRLGSDPSNPQGWKYWITCSVVPQTNKLPDGEEVVIGYILTLVDITSIKLNEEYQRQLSTQAVERRRQQENFIDVFSHELRNPFSATLQCADGILSALMEFQNTEEQGHGLDVEEMIDSASTILVCVQHQMRIIDDVLTLSKLDSMLLSVVPVDVQIHETVNQIMKIFQSELHVKGISSQYLLEDSYKGLAIDWIKADPSRFSQILMNLVTNAIKFTSLQTGKREIVTRLGASLERPTGHGDVVYRKGDQVRLPQDVSHADWGTGELVYILITVQDSGIGISDEWQKKLFKRFEQVPRTHVTYGGSGLGLFICRQLCRIQGGEIGVYSEEGHGSSFSFYIQARRSTGPSVTPQAASPHPLPENLDRKLSKFEEIATGSGEVGVVAMKAYPVSKTLESGTIRREQVSYNVLIVEDNLINQEVLRRQLRKEGCATHVAGNGEEALKVISESIFAKEGGVGIDIVLMDMEMPVMDGNTATLKIREMERSGIINRHVPIMGISANARPEQVAKMTEAGMDDAISKPFRIIDLLIRFDSLLRKLQDNGSTNLLDISRADDMRSRK